VFVPQARQKIVGTAQENGIPWKTCLAWLKSQSGPWQADEVPTGVDDVPAYYRRAFHAYEQGNLCWEAALEVELASAAVGARNFPDYGAKGEQAFRGAFVNVFTKELCVSVTEQAIIVDLGCGTGMSTRPLAQNYPQAQQIIGIDLSPYFVAVGRKLLELAPRSFHEGGPWVSEIQSDARIDYRVANAAHTQLPAAIADVVNLQFVAHELPLAAAKDVVDEAYRILKPGGQLWVGEMDFESPGYAAQRANPLLFSLIRATEPYLDDYAEGQTALRQHIAARFATTRVTAATGRHYALLAVKHTVEEEATADQSGSLVDDRFDEEGNYRVQDTHLQVWENKA
jgi:ubiquinone/menaquinone biosynthesis C-methylase UbiE